MIAVVDFGAGNLRSVVNAFDAIDRKVHVTSEPRDLLGRRATQGLAVGRKDHRPPA
jgi:imidazoleglycerol phosphate synthase glutamine amidotransferase subunit HisH